MLVGNSNTSGLFSAYHALSNFCASFFFFLNFYLNLYKKTVRLFLSSDPRKPRLREVPARMWLSRDCDTWSLVRATMLHPNVPVAKKRGNSALGEACQLTFSRRTDDKVMQVELCVSF